VKSDREQAGHLLALVAVLSAAPRAPALSLPEAGNVLLVPARIRPAPLPSGPGWVEVPVRFSLH